MLAQAIKITNPEGATKKPLRVQSNHRMDLFLWIDKFHLCEGVSHWFANTNISTVDMMVWEKPNIGMGYRTRNKCEFMLILQKKPIKAKSTWTVHNIPNVWKEKVDTKNHPHTKPIRLQQALLSAVTKENDIVVDPAWVVALL